jgi:hypothetical protein
MKTPELRHNRRMRWDTDRRQALNGTPQGGVL